MVTPASLAEVYDPTGRRLAPGVVRERSATRLVAAVALAGSGPGTYTVKVVNPDGLRSRGATVSLAAEVSVSPSSGPPGTTFTYSGRGFTAGFGATSRLRRPDGREFPAKRMPIRADGTFEDVIWSGEFVPGTYTVWATDDSTEVSTPPATFLVTR